MAVPPSPADVAEQPEDSPVPVSAPAWLVALPWVLGLLFLLPNYAFFYDNLVYANQITLKEWDQRVHPHHLGYNPGLWLVWQLTGQQVSPLWLMVALGRLTGIASLFTLRRLGVQLGLPVASQAGLLVSYALCFGIWFHATAGAAYVPALWCTLQVLTRVLDWPATGPSPAQLRSAGGWFLAGVLIHQLAVLILIPACLWLLLQGESTRWQQVRRITVAWFGTAVAIYAVVFMLLFRSLNPGALWHWATRYGHAGTWWWWQQLPSNTNDPAAGFWLRWVSESQARVLWATPFGQHLPPITTEPLAMAFQVAWPTARYLVPVILLLALLAWGLCWPRAWTARRGGTTWLYSRWLWGWVAPFLLLSLLFDPSNAGFRLYYLVPLLLLLLAPLAAPLTTARRLLLLACLPLGAFFTLGTNYAYGWQPLSSPLVNPRYDELVFIREMPPGPLLVGAAEGPDWLDTQYMLQFTDRPLWQVSGQSAAAYRAAGSPATVDDTDVLFVQAWLFETLQDTAPAARPAYLRCVPLNPPGEPRWLDLREWGPIRGWDRGYYRVVELQAQSGSAGAN